MDDLKRKRRMQRAAFTKELNILNQGLAADMNVQNAKISFQMLEEKMVQLSITSEKFIDALLEDPEMTEETLEKEVEDADEYKRKYLAAKYVMEQRLITPTNVDVTQNGTAAQPESRKTYRLPQIELCKFGGDIKEWLQFWSLFKKIHEDSDISKEDKFQYLIQAMIPGSRAACLVKSYPPTGDNYDKVIAGLKNRFGDDSLQIEVYVRELLQLVLKNSITPAKDIQLSTLYDKIESHLRALESLGVTSDKCAAMLFPLVESSLPEELLRAWQRSSAMHASVTQDTENADTQAEDRLTQLIKFLEAEVQNELRISMAVKGFDLKSSEQNDNAKVKKQKYRNDEKNVPSAMGLLSTRNKITPCLFCDSSDHESISCEKAKKMTIAQRREVVKNKHACFNCLKFGHGSKQCRCKLKCAWCSRRHVLIMCPEVETKDVTEDSTTIKNDCSLANQCSDPEVFMQTVKVKLCNGNKQISVRAVIDTGSQKSYITKEMCKLVNYEPISEQLMIHSLFGGKNSGTVSHKKYNVHLKSLDDKNLFKFVALDQNVICNHVPSVKNGIWIEELEKLNIKISDMGSDDHSVAVLIGADYAGRLLTGRRRLLDTGLVAVETLLGWTLMGEVPQNDVERENPVLLATTLFVKNDNIADLWSLDVLGIKDPIELKTQGQLEEEVTQELLKTLKINEEGRYEVELPWLPNHPELKDNKEMAKKRLQLTVKKLKSEGLYEAYGAVFDDWMQEGIIEYVPKEEENQWGRYLPHRHVVKENSTTKLRPVFDGSAKDKSSPSLNECLERGPNLIEMVTSNLFRFRQGKIGIVSDIKKAFLQIGIDPRDRDSLRFLWLTDKEEIVILRHRRVVFGVNSSSFILNVVINEHLQKTLDGLHDGSITKYCKENISKLKKSFYVDNCLASINSKEELTSFITDSRAVMEEAGFDLRGWEYNDDNSPEIQAVVLGLIWNKEDDCFYLNLSALDQFCDEKITKRKILSFAHRIFDPLGMVCPIMLCPRILIQEAWAQNLAWDDEVHESVKFQFLKWVKNLKDLHKVKIPRVLFGDVNPGDNISIHTFCDASKIAYAAVVFIRIENETGVRVNFIQAKTRVAPLKKNNTESRQSIPRLELLAATIGVRLTESILSSIDAIEVNKIKVFYWSDSSTVIAWIRRDCNWGTFVWNRVQEIRKRSNPDQWNHVPGNSNPADLPSRGGNVDQLISSKWWEGPSWLYLKNENWPKFESSYDESEITMELKKSSTNKTVKNAILMFATTNSEIVDTSSLIKKCSSYFKLKRIVAWIFRFVKNCKSTRESRITENLSFDETQDAENLIIKLIQEETFTGIKDERIKQFLPFKDDQGLIRIKTKITLREDLYNFRCPAILPGNHGITEMIIEERHKELNHAGVEILMNSLREKFWILGGRKIIRTIIRHCVDCQRHDAKHLQTIPAPLPQNRVRDAAIFEILGVDLTGPIYLRGGQKAWICLFTCAVFRAVHLELVTSLSTASFLLALRRHIARRGRPSIIYSDNGTNFVGLNNSFNRIDFAKLAQTKTMKQIKWIFNPPTAAWWGGFWERMNGVLKRLLRRTLKKSCLNYEEMLTVLLDCEAVINSRPITFLSENDHEIVPLSPSMFLQEIKEIGVVDLDQIENCQLDRKYIHRQKIKDALRSRFRNEYLGALVIKSCKIKNARSVSEGDIVLIEIDDKKRLDWPLARVKKVITGKDGQIRVVRLTTSNGELTRPIQRIYPLELKRDDLDICYDEVVIDRYKEIEETQLNEKINETVCVNEKTTNCEPKIVTTRSGRKVKRPDRLLYY